MVAASRFQIRDIKIPGGASGKELSSANAEDTGVPGSIPGSGRFLGGGQGLKILLA